MRNPSLNFQSDVRVEIHARLVRPLLDMTLLFLGLPLIVARESRNVFIAMGICMALIGRVYGRGHRGAILGGDLVLVLHPAAGGMVAADDFCTPGGWVGRVTLAVDEAYVFGATCPQRRRSCHECSVAKKIATTHFPWPRSHVL